MVQKMQASTRGAWSRRDVRGPSSSRHATVREWKGTGRLQQADVQRRAAVCGAPCPEHSLIAFQGTVGGRVHAPMRQCQGSLARSQRAQGCTAMWDGCAAGCA